MKKFKIIICLSGLFFGLSAQGHGRIYDNMESLARTTNSMLDTAQDITILYREYDAITVIDCVSTSCNIEQTKKINMQTELIRESIEVSREWYVLLDTFKIKVLEIEAAFGKKPFSEKIKTHFQILKKRGEIAVKEYENVFDKFTNKNKK